MFPGDSLRTLFTWVQGSHAEGFYSKEQLSILEHQINEEMTWLFKFFEKMLCEKTFEASASSFERKTVFVGSWRLESQKLPAFA